MRTLKNIYRGWFTTLMGCLILGITLYNDTQMPLDHMALVVRVGLGIVLIFCPKTVEQFFRRYTNKARHNYPHYNHYINNNEEELPGNEF